MLQQMIRDCLKFLSESWQTRPAVVVLTVIALVVLLIVLIDAHRHRRKDQKRRQDKYPHQLDQ